MKGRKLDKLKKIEKTNLIPFAIESGIVLNKYNNRDWIRITAALLLTHTNPNFVLTTLKPPIPRSVQM